MSYNKTSMWEFDLLIELANLNAQKIDLSFCVAIGPPKLRSIRPSVHKGSGHSHDSHQNFNIPPQHIETSILLQHIEMNKKINEK